MADVFGVGVFNNMLSAAKSLKDLNDTVVRNRASIDLQGQILTAQEAYSTLLKKVDALEAEVASFKNWESEKQRYELKNHPALDETILAYALKEGVEPPEPPHSICPDCYSQRKKSILQRERRIGGAQILTCNACGWDGYLGGLAPASANARRRK